MHAWFALKQAFVHNPVPAWNLRYNLLVCTVGSFLKTTLRIVIGYTADSKMAPDIAEQMELFRSQLEHIHLE